MIKIPTDEFILCAAINYGGIIICGFRHGDCYATLKSLSEKIDKNKFLDRDSQGFLTSRNRYVNREEAWIIAKTQEQIIYGLEASDWDDYDLIKWLDIKEKPKSMLISENLY